MTPVPTTIVIRPALIADLNDLLSLIDEAIATLQAEYLTPAQVAASRAFMGLDTQLVRDGTYLVAELDGKVVGCGGWSRRTTLYGGDESVVRRDAALLDPNRDPARIRAMYTHPAFTRRGVGSRILTACEEAASQAGFRTVELMATMSGEALYRNAGYLPLEDVSVTSGGVAVPFIRMRKAIDPGVPMTIYSRTEQAPSVTGTSSITESVE